MNCSICNSQWCQCQMRMANQQAAQGLAGQYSIMIGQGGNRINLSDDPDYQMFKKYAHLSDQEMMEVFLTEQRENMKLAEEGAAMLIQKAKDRNQAAKEQFWEWCKKYQRNMTEEKFNTYFKVFL